MNVLPFVSASRLFAALASLTLLVSAAQASAADVLPGPVISVSQLKELVNRKQVTVLDTRELLQSDQKTPNYAAGHIPGALPLPYSSFRGPTDNPGAVIAIDRLTALVRPLGLTLERPIVLAGSGSDPSEFGGPARIYWTLKAAGFKNLAILNGGLGAWMAEKLPIETASPQVTSSSISLRYRPDYMLSTDELIKRLSGSTASRPALIDSRPEDFFSGEMRHPAAARWGTLPGARNFDSAEFFVPNTGRLLSRTQLKTLAEQEGLLAPQPSVTFCNSGHWSSTHWFVLHEILGQSQVQLYPESVVAWSKTGQPMDKEPSRATVLKRQLQGTGVMQ